jgi:hypothetical protein
MLGAATDHLNRPAGLWLDLEQLLDLPLEGEGRAQLWRLALGQQADQPTARRSLLIALARHCGQSAVAASAEGQWALATDYLEEAIGHYQEIGQADGERQLAARQELAGLLGCLIGNLHGAVHADGPPPAEERGALCWRGYQLAVLHRQLGVERPDWLLELEEQLVREGGISLRQLATDPSAPSDSQQRMVWRRQALELLLHLSRLHVPCPEWIDLAARELLAVEIELLGAGDVDQALDPDGVRRLLGWLPRLPLDAQTAAAVQLALERARLSLELLESTTTRRSPQAAPAVVEQVVEAPVQRAVPRPTPEPQPQPQPEREPFEGAFGQAADLARYLMREVAGWLDHHGVGAGPVHLGLALAPDQKPVTGGPGHLQLNLSPLLAFPQVEQLDLLICSFFEPLQQSAQGEGFVQEEPNGAVFAALADLWRQGKGLDPSRFPGLVYATSLWSRCGGADGLGAKQEGWSLPVTELRPGQLLVRPGNVELAALQSAIAGGDGLEQALMEIRRHHHDRAWMEQQSEQWWMDPSDPVENIRRLHTNAGFYASSHAPLESLQQWSQATIAALLGDEVLFGNDSIVRMFLPVAQQLQRQSGKVPALVQWPGEKAFYAFIAGQEVLFVTPLAAEIEAHHRSGKAFALFTDLLISPYGLRCIPAPMSIYPNRPERGFEDSLERCLEQVDRSYRQRPFSVFTAAAGAYGLPLCQAVHRRYGVTSLYVGNAMHTYFGVEQNTTTGWMAERRQNQNWLRAVGLNGVPGVDRIEGGRYLG